MANDIYPPDYETDVGRVRMLISDTEQYDYDQDNTLRYRLPDGQITAYLEMADGKLFAAAASALFGIANNEALVSKVIKTEDLQTDGAKLSDALRLMARDMLNRQNAEDDKQASKDAFVYIPMSYPYSNPDW